MPIEIKELVIRAVVSPGAAPAAGEGSAISGDAAPALHDGGAPEAMVQECVRQVLRILAKERER